MTRDLRNQSVGSWALIAVYVIAASCNSATRRPPDAGTDANPAADAAAGTDSRSDVPNDTAADSASDGPADAATDVTADAGDALAADVAGDSAATDGATDGPPGPIVTVSSFGCFARSGDGDDYFADGTPAVLVTSSPWRAPCDLAWIGLNDSGYTKPTLPSTESLSRRFILDSLISDRATLTVSFEVDDAAEVVLNGKLIASCTPPAGNVGECQSSCHVVTFSKDDLKPVGQVNVLEMKMINLANTGAPGGNTGYTGLSYSICATGE